MSGRLKGRRRAQAGEVLTASLDVLGRAGDRDLERLDPLEARLTASGRVPVHARMVPSGRVFGGTVDLELATAVPVAPGTHGIEVRGRGLVRMRGVAFRGAQRDGAGQRVAARLEADPALVRALSAVHFQRVRVDPDGRAVLRHLGGCLVWMLLPPLSRPVPLVAEQAEAALAALETFADAGTRLEGDPGRDDRPVPHRNP